MGLALGGATERLQYEARERISLAWHTEAFARLQRLPRLDKVLPRERRSRATQTPDEMLAIARRWERAAP